MQLEELVRSEMRAHPEAYCLDLERSPADEHDSIIFRAAAEVTQRHLVIFDAAVGRPLLAHPRNDVQYCGHDIFLARSKHGQFCGVVKSKARQCLSQVVREDFAKFDVLELVASHGGAEIDLMLDATARVIIMQHSGSTEESHDISALAPPYKWFFMLT
eukprot:gnl/TRDRNA2_/TRDRNA2_68193_c0_seq1.p1 gnl/TRDRNA2_/TRDRNA2_68193_c0~~gnl/TRDRNA2_/TRDRNA2_68193_c0_seq1.p1  ORF type:complete len:159 (-),score=24.45 gnl/TRDRNA2_/TRDRNA2_68193_c0_seq1:106-582(-)